MNLKIGDKAPDFEGKNQNNESVKLSSFIGEKVVLYFYPRDNTPGCTAQACNLKDNFNELSRKGYQIIGVSSDSIKSHKKFEEKYSLPFDLISDEEGSLCESFGTWKEKKNYGRTYMGIERSTFIIDEEGKIIKIWRKVRVNGHVEEVLDFIKGI